MCRMLERYMDNATKEKMLARVQEIERTGLSYSQAGVAYCTHHFELAPLIQALKFYADNYRTWHAAASWALMDAAFMEVGKAQRDVPAHVAQEYCRSDRGFFPCPLFNESTLPRVLTFYHWGRYQFYSWFPLTSSNSGLGFNFAIIRARDRARGGNTGRHSGHPFSNFEAITRLDEVRTADLSKSRKHLSPPPISQNLSM